MDAALPSTAQPVDRGALRRRITMRQLAYIAGERMLDAAARTLDRAPLNWAEVTLAGATVIDNVHAIRLAGPVAEVSTRRGDWDMWFRVDQVTAVRILPGA